MANCKCKEFLENVTVECDWKDMALLGLCAGSLGKLMGMMVPEKYKNAAAFGAGAAFFLSGITLAVRTIEESRHNEWDEYEDFEEWETWDDEEDEEEDPGFVMKITAEE